MLRLALAVKARLPSKAQANQERPQGQTVETELDPSQAQLALRRVSRFEENRRIVRAVSNEYGIETMFVIQPDAAHNYPVELLRRPPPDYWATERHGRELFHSALSESTDLVYLGNLFEDYGLSVDRKAVIDGVHYSPNFNQFLAETVASRINLIRLASSGSTGG